MQAITEHFADLLVNTRLEPDLPYLLSSFVHVFHAAYRSVERELDDNEAKQRTSQRQQDGSEIASVELEQLIAQGLTLLERRNAFDAMRADAASAYQALLGKVWLPRTGSLVSGRHLTSATIDSRDYLNAKRQLDLQPLVPQGPKIIISGPDSFQDYRLIYTTLDSILAKYPDLVLVHGGMKKGPDLIAATWATNKKVQQIVCKPDWSKHTKSAAPFKRNDTMLNLAPIGVVMFGNHRDGIQGNLRDKAKKLGIKTFIKEGGA